MSTPQYPGYAPEPYGQPAYPGQQQPFPGPGHDGQPPYAPYGAPAFPPSPADPAGGAPLGADPYAPAVPFAPSGSDPYAAPAPYGADPHGADPYAADPYARPSQGPGGPAEPGTRAVAFLIDSLIPIGVAVVFGVLAGVLAFTVDPGVALIVLLATYAALLAWFLVYTGMQGGSGSIGAKARRIRIVRADTGGPLGFGRALLRNIVLGLTGAVFLLGYFSILFDKSGRRQGWHDKAAGAMVVDAPRDEQPAPPEGFAAYQRTSADPYATPAPPADAHAAPTPDPYAAPAPDSYSAPAPEPYAAPGAYGAEPPRPGTAYGAPPAEPYAAPSYGHPVDPYVSAADPYTQPADPYAAADSVSNAGVTADPFAAGSATADPSEPPRESPYAPPAAAYSAPPASPYAPPPVVPTRPADPVADASATAIPEPSAFSGSQPSFAEPPAPTVSDPLISSVPGVPTGGADRRQPAPPPASDEFIDDTVIVQRHRPGATKRAVLVWDDDIRHSVTSRSVFGRNPSPVDDAEAVAVRDTTLSLSKTHFAIDVDPTGAWLTDLHSTNGVVIVRQGDRVEVTPGLRTPLEPGDALEMGDRVVTFEALA